MDKPCVLYYVPDASTAIPRGPCNDALVAAPLSPVLPEMPDPAKVDTVPCAY